VTLAEELSARCADAHDGGSEVRTVREVVRRFQTRWRSRQQRSGQPDRSRHDGRRPDCAGVAPQGAASGRSRSRGSTRGARCEACDEPAARRFWNRRSGAREDDEGRQRSERARWRLLQPMRRGRSVTRSAARRWPSNCYDEGHVVEARATTRSG